MNATSPAGAVLDDRPVLHLTAVVRVVDWSVRPRDGQSQQQSALRIIVIQWRASAPVMRVAG